MSSTINKLGIGTVQFGADYGISNEKGKTSFYEVKKIFEYAEKFGIKYVDTANAYGDAEEILGQLCLSKFNVVSKYIPTQESSLNDQFKASLKKMKLSKLYAYMAHRPLDLIENENKAWKKLLRLKQKGLVKKIGVSFNTVDEYQILKSHKIKPDIVQMPFNYFDNRFVSIMKELKQNNCEIHTRSTFLQGLFFCNLQTLNPFFNDIFEDLNTLQKYDNLAKRLLKYAITKDFIDVVIIGVNNFSQLEENAKGIDNNAFELPEFSKTINRKILTPSLWPKN